MHRPTHIPSEIPPESKKKNIHSSLLELYSCLKLDKLQLVSNSSKNNIIYS